MSKTEKHLKRIQDKLQELLKYHVVLQKENSRLKEELDHLSKQTIGYQQNIDELKQQVNILKLGGGEMDDNDKKNFEKRINKYIKEIDRCVDLLSK